MGIIKAVTQAVGGAFADQWLEVIEADNIFIPHHTAQKNKKQREYG